MTSKTIKIGQKWPIFDQKIVENRKIFARKPKRRKMAQIHIEVPVKRHPFCTTRTHVAPEHLGANGATFLNFRPFLGSDIADLGYFWPKFEGKMAKNRPKSILNVTSWYCSIRIDIWMSNHVSLLIFWIFARKYQNRLISHFCPHLDHCARVAPSRRAK